MTESDARVAHIGVAVTDLEEAAAFYQDVLGLKPSQPVTADGATIVPLKLGDVEIELMRPDTDDGPVAKFIETFLKMQRLRIKYCRTDIIFGKEFLQPVPLWHCYRVLMIYTDIVFIDLRSFNRRTGKNIIVKSCVFSSFGVPGIKVL